MSGPQLSSGRGNAATIASGKNIKEYYTNIHESTWKMGSGMNTSLFLERV